MLQATGNRVIVTPDTAADETEAGLIIPESARKDPPMSGRIVAVGRGPRTAHRIREATIAHCMALVDQVAEDVPCAALRGEIIEALGRYQREASDLSTLATGDRVVFPYTAGTSLTVDGVPYIVLNEDQIEAVWQEEAV